MSKLTLLEAAKRDLEIYLECHVKDYHSIDDDLAIQLCNMHSLNIFKAWRMISKFIEQHQDK